MFEENLPTCNSLHATYILRFCSKILGQSNFNFSCFFLGAVLRPSCASRIFSCSVLCSSVSRVPCSFRCSELFLAHGTRERAQNTRERERESTRSTRWHKNWQQEKRQKRARNTRNHKQSDSWVAVGAILQRQTTLITHVGRPCLHFHKSKKM